MKFKDFINQEPQEPQVPLQEDKTVNYNGLTVYGDVLTVAVEKGQYNDLMGITISGNERTLTMRSAETIKADYAEEDWNIVEKLYNTIAEKRASQIEKLVYSFEKDLNKVVSEMDKDLKKLFKNKSK